MCARPSYPSTAASEDGIGKWGDLRTEGWGSRTATLRALGSGGRTATLRALGSGGQRVQGSPASGSTPWWAMASRTTLGSMRPARCLLYTSDAADDLLCVDLGGRRIIK